jgi:hypothetical protein
MRDRIETENLLAVSHENEGFSWKPYPSDQGNVTQLGDSDHALTMFHVAGEFMAFLAFDIIYPDLGLKEGIDLGPPVLLQAR